MVRPCDSGVCQRARIAFVNLPHFRLPGRSLLPGEVKQSGLLELMNTLKRTMSPTEWFMLVALSALWGGSFFFVGVAVKDLPPITTAALRIGLAALALNLLLRGIGIKIPMDRALWRDFLIMGTLNLAIPFALIAWGQVHIASGLASIFNATTPFSTTIVAHFLTHDERIRPGRLAGVSMAFAGVVLIIGLDALDGLGIRLGGELAVLAATWCYAFAGVFGRRFFTRRYRVMGVNPLVTAAGQMTGATVVIVPFALLIEHPWTLDVPSWEAGASIAGMSLLSTALASILYFRVLSSAGATNSMLVTLLMPVTAILLGVTVLGERLDFRHFVGMALLAAGLVAVDGRIISARPRRSRSTVNAPSEPMKESD